MYIARQLKEYVFGSSNDSKSGNMGDLTKENISLDDNTDSIPSIVSDLEGTTVDSPALTKLTKNKNALSGLEKSVNDRVEISSPNIDNDKNLRTTLFEALNNSEQFSELLNTALKELLERERNSFENKILSSIQEKLKEKDEQLRFLRESNNDLKAALETQKEDHERSKRDMEEFGAKMEKKIDSLSTNMREIKIKVERCPEPVHEEVENIKVKVTDLAKLIDENTDLVRDLQHRVEGNQHTTEEDVNRALEGQNATIKRVSGEVEDCIKHQQDATRRVELLVDSVEKIKKEFGDLRDAIAMTKRNCSKKGITAELHKLVQSIDKDVKIVNGVQSWHCHIIDRLSGIEEKVVLLQEKVARQDNAESNCEVDSRRMQRETQNSGVHIDNRQHNQLANDTRDILRAVSRLQENLLKLTPPNLKEEFTESDFEIPPDNEALDLSDLGSDETKPKRLTETRPKNKRLGLPRSRSDTELKRVNEDARAEVSRQRFPDHLSVSVMDESQSTYSPGSSMGAPASLTNLDARHELEGAVDMRSTVDQRQYQLDDELRRGSIVRKQGNMRVLKVNGATASRTSSIYSRTMSHLI